MQNKEFHDYDTVNDLNRDLPSNEGNAVKFIIDIIRTALDDYEAEVRLSDDNALVVGEQRDKYGEKIPRRSVNLVIEADTEVEEMEDVYLSAMEELEVGLVLDVIEVSNWTQSGVFRVKIHLGRITLRHH